MSKERELLKRSVRIIESLGPDDEAYNLIDKITELLAQPEPFMFKNRQLAGSLISYDAMYKKGYAQAKIDLKPEPLSDEDVRAIVNQMPTEVDLDTGIDFCRIIEKAHGIGVDE